MAVPAIVLKPVSPTVTRQHLTAQKIIAIRTRGLSWVTLDRKFYSLKSHGRCRTQVSGDVWCDFPRIGELIRLITEIGAVREPGVSFELNLSRLRLRRTR